MGMNRPISKLEPAQHRFSSACCQRIALRISICALVLATGCATLRDRNPIDEDVIIARQLSQQGVDARQEGDWSAAEDRFRSAIKYCPEDHTARVHYAECLWRRGASEEAIDELSKAIELSDGNDVDSISRMGEMAQQMGDTDAANKLVVHALGVNPTNAKAWKLKASLLRAAGRDEASLACYHRALSYSPDDKDIQAATAEIYFANDRPDRAVAVLDRVLLDFEPGERRGEVLHMRGLALAQLKRTREAIESLELARDSSTMPSGELLADLGDLQLQSGQLAEARQTIDDAFRIATSRERVRLEKMQGVLAAQLSEATIVR
jgi:tetratricopeptide (TPR) repeat protein